MIKGIERKEEDRRRGRSKESAMEAMKNLFLPKPNPQQQLREWQRKLRQEARNVERQVRGKSHPPFFV
mgnify:CR=1 FL=1